MAKGKKGSTKMVSPLYVSGSHVGQVAGPTSGVSPKDPFGYLTKSGQSAPGGSPADRPS